MKVINLDQFKRVQKVSIDGVEYEVTGITAEQFIGGFLDEATAGLSDREQFEKMIQALREITTVPEDKLRKMDIGVLTALMMVAQGVDPTAKPKDAVEGDAEKK